MNAPNHSVRPARCPLRALSLLLACFLASVHAGAGHTEDDALPEETAHVGQHQQYSEWNGRGFAPPSGLAPAVADEPRLEGSRLARQAFELSAQGSVSQKLCAPRLRGCKNTPGYTFQLSFLSRNTPYFGWGLSAQWSEFAEAVEQPQFSASLRNVGAAGLLFGRLSMFREGVFEPYIQAGFGAGSFTSSGQIRTRGEGITVSAGTFSPIYQASAGLDVHLTKSVSVGGVFNWTHWLISDFERCQNVAFGVCGVPGPGRFDLENAVWSLGATTSFAFGQSL